MLWIVTIAMPLLCYSWNKWITQASAKSFDLWWISYEPSYIYSCGNSCIGANYAHELGWLESPCKSHLRIRAHNVGPVWRRDIRSTLIDINNNVKFLNCDMCQFSKSCRNLYPININKNNSGPFYFIHSEVLYAPFSLYSPLLCYFYRRTWVHFMNSKDVKVHMFKTYHKMAETMFDKK